jgi:hypothetical protein
MHSTQQQQQQQHQQHSNEHMTQHTTGNTQPHNHTSTQPHIHTTTQPHNHTATQHLTISLSSRLSLQDDVLQRDGDLQERRVHAEVEKGLLVFGRGDDVDARGGVGGL